MWNLRSQSDTGIPLWAWQGKTKITRLATSSSTHVFMHTKIAHTHVTKRLKCKYLNVGIVVASMMING